MNKPKFLDHYNCTLRVVVTLYFIIRVSLRNLITMWIQCHSTEWLIADSQLVTACTNLSPLPNKNLLKAVIIRRSSLKINIWTTKLWTGLMDYMYGVDLWIWLWTEIWTEVHVALIQSSTFTISYLESLPKLEQSLWCFSLCLNWHGVGIKIFGTVQNSAFTINLVIP